MMTTTLHLTIVDIVGIRVEPFDHVPKITIQKSINGAPSSDH